MRTSEETDKIALAYVAAWAELTNPPKDGTANYGKFATLPALLDHVKGPLTANGIAVMQEAVTTELGVGCVTRLVHTSGQFYEFGPLTFATNGAAQQGGSAETYARRYQLSAAVGVAADEDDDGAKASTSEPTTARSGSDHAGVEDKRRTPPSSTPAPSVEAGGQSDSHRGRSSGAPASTSPSEPGEAHKAPRSANSTPGSEESEEAGGGTKQDQPRGTPASSADQRERLLAVYGRPSAIKVKAVELFGYPDVRQVDIGALTASEIEALILEAAK